jgi:hypothetical protein
MAAALAALNVTEEERMVEHHGFHGEGSGEGATLMLSHFHMDKGTGTPLLFAKLWHCVLLADDDA